MDYHRGYSYDRRISSEHKAAIRERMAIDIFRETLLPSLLTKPRFHAVKLDIYEAPCAYLGGIELVELRMDLTVNEAEERIIHYADYRPMDWYTLSGNACEEIKRRVRAWWRRPLEIRVWNWKQRIARFEKKHFGASF